MPCKIEGVICCCFLLPAAAIVLLCLEARATDLEVEEGSRVRLLCKTSSDLLDRSHLQVRWYQNGRELNMNVTQSNKIIKNINNKKYSQKADKTRFTLVIRNAQLEDAGLYTCEGYYANGSVLWTTTSLAVKGRPGPPTSVEVRSCHGNRAELAWRAAPPNGAKIREYSLEFNTSEEPDVWYPYYERIPGDRHEFFVDLPPYGIYTFRLLARNDIGDSQPSDVTRRSCTTPPDKPDRSPKQVVTRTHKKGYLVIEWTLQYWKSSEGRRKMQEVDITVTPDTVERHPVVRATLAGLPANIALRGQVAVRNTHYTGPPSKTIDFFTPEGMEGAQLGPVRNLKPKIDDPETLQAKITGLEPANNYRLVVSARTSSGRGKGSPVPVYMVVLPVVAGLTLIAVAVTVLLKLKRTKKQEENMNMKWKQVITSDV
ncbi:neural cell adhesion molecule L1-like protein isoform X4 [Pomacea canaliculata]|uniref:neural cell adhesion molecule L1-like protein isoform X4 n=1 Tax=Pomacea canaliculata TaxID=400727 RepID=UPI000D72CBC6|nr:neural cell adhesion molecule L1-like protein isoform X4 [Pomacea canaliculata]